MSGRVLLAAAVVMAAGAASSRADLFLVDTTVDAVDATPGDGLCDTGAGECSLRAAVQEANEWPGADEIELPAGTFLFTLLGSDSQAAVGDLDVRDHLLVRGAGAELTTIDGAGDEAIFSAIAVELELQDMTLTNAASSAVFGSNGPTSLYLRGCTLRNNTGRDGAAVNIHRGACLEMTDCLVEDNMADEDGGGVMASQVEAHFARCTFRSNSCGGLGGGAYVASDPGRTLLVEDCLFELNQGRSAGGLSSASPTRSGPGPTTRIVHTDFIGNSATSGSSGGLFSATDTVIDGCRFEMNRATNGGAAHVREGSLIRCSEFILNESDNGGGVGKSGALDLGSGAHRVEDCLFRQNRAAGSGGACDLGTLGSYRFERCRFEGNQGAQGGAVTTWENAVFIDCDFLGNTAESQAGGLQSVRQVRIEGCTFRGNRSVGSGGGGLRLQARQDSWVVNTTISGNEARFGGGLVVASESPGRLHLQNCTITGNAADAGGGLWGYINDGVMLENAILAGNTAVGAGPDCHGELGSLPFTSAGRVLIGDPADCDFVSGPGDQLGVDPFLLPLADNDGLTLTHALDPLSPAIDAGDPSGCSDGEGSTLARGQRGVARPFDGNGDGEARCDLGAFEYTTEDTSDVGTENLQDCAQAWPLPPLPACFVLPDADGDGVPDGGDCAPMDATLIRVPGPLALDVRRDDATLAALLSWTDARPEAGSASTHELASGLLSELPLPGLCLPPDDELSHRDARSAPGDGHWYLVRGVNACGPGSGEGWGLDSLARERAGCP